MTRCIIYIYIYIYIILQYIKVNTVYNQDWCLVILNISYEYVTITMSVDARPCINTITECLLLMIDK